MYAEHVVPAAAN